MRAGATEPAALRPYPTLGGKAQVPGEAWISADMEIARRKASTCRDPVEIPADVTSWTTRWTRSRPSGLSRRRAFARAAAGDCL
jgi:hypothetical protein